MDPLQQICPGIHQGARRQANSCPQKRQPQAPGLQATGLLLRSPCPSSAPCAACHSCPARESAPPGRRRHCWPRLRRRLLRWRRRRRHVRPVAARLQGWQPDVKLSPTKRWRQGTLYWQAVERQRAVQRAPGAVAALLPHVCCWETCECCHAARRRCPRAVSVAGSVCRPPTAGRAALGQEDIGFFCKGLLEVSILHRLIS